MASTIYYTIIIVSLMFLLLTIFIVYLAIFQNKRKLLFKQQLLQTQLEIQEQTLKNISQEIHDNIGQALSLAKLNVNTMNCEEPDALQVKITDSRVLISKAIQDLRDLSRSLNTDYVTEMGLLRSVEYELELIKRTGTLDTYLKIDGSPFRLEPQQELILFRMVQELLHNIIKHAKATLVDVGIQFEPSRFSLTVTDNGIGFDAGERGTNAHIGTGLGIRNMHNRAKMINAGFNLESVPGQGVKAKIDLPVAPILK